jgi:hypothetical protein
MSLASSIIGGFGALKLLHKNPTFAAFYSSIFMYGNVVFNLIFNRTYRIPEKVKEIKREMVVDSGKWRVQPMKGETKRVARSIQELGIRAGSFNVMERESTLIFVDFGVRQIVSLLLAF